jgi:glyoxalase family protein
MARTISGIHHITAIASDPQKNLDFYTEVLGLRLVKLTVNFDDPGTYHFYFGDERGSPGSLLTFFPWPGAYRGGVGNGQVSATTFAVPPASIDFWMSRLRQHQVMVEDAGTRFGQAVVRFADPDGLPLELVATAHADPSRAGKGGLVAPEQAIGGFHSATLSVEGYEETAKLVADVMGLEYVGTEGNRYRYAAGSGEGPASIVDLVCTPDGRFGRPGAGTVHHIAWRTPDDAQQVQWRADLVGRGYNVTPVMDRCYFHSIYFREPGGVLFEIATDPPGFAIDEPREHLGERLMLPYWLESGRAEIERTLPRLTRSPIFAKGPAISPEA